MSVIERFLNKIQINDKGCWEWTSSKNNNGYGRFSVDGKMALVHRFIYEYYHGEITHNLRIHHLCYNRTCSNPLHLQQRTHKENVLDHDSSAPSAINSRKTHCIRGHEFTPENTYLIQNGRRCRICSNISVRAWQTNNKKRFKKNNKIYYQNHKTKSQRILIKTA